MAAPIIGIDLGTTNSCAAVVEANGNVKLIPYKGGDFTIPSIFAIDDKGHELIGHEAKRQWQLNPRNTVYAVQAADRAASSSPTSSTPCRRWSPTRWARASKQRRGGQGRQAKLRHVRDRRPHPEQDPRRRPGLPAAEGRARGGHRARLLHRPAAPGGQGRRQAHRPRGGADHQRAHRGRARLRRRQGAATRRCSSTTSAAAPSTSR